jgi:site-specific DNA-methyltransferase (adenine-specific)
VLVSSDLVERAMPDNVTLLTGDCRKLLRGIQRHDVAVVIVDPPYGASTPSWPDRTRRAAIAGDEDTAVRDYVLRWAHGLPVACFGSWRRPVPKKTRARLLWDKGPCTGTGNLSIPWKDQVEDIYLLGPWAEGERTSCVLRAHMPVASVTPRMHPHEKPLSLLARIIEKAPPGLVLDPCCGSGSTLLAARALRRPAIGIEIDLRWVKIAQERLRQREMFLEPLPCP